MTTSSFNPDSIWRKFFMVMIGLLGLLTVIFIITNYALNASHLWPGLIKNTAYQATLLENILHSTRKIDINFKVDDDLRLRAEISRLKKYIAEFNQNEETISATILELKKLGKFPTGISSENSAYQDEKLIAVKEKLNRNGQAIIISVGRDQNAIQSILDMESDGVSSHFSQLTLTYEQAAKSDLRLLYNVELWGYIASLFIISLLTLMIFMPLSTAISKFTLSQRAVNKALEASNTSLEINQEELLELEMQHTMAEELGEFGSWRLNLETRQVYWSDGIYAIHERPKEKGVPSLEDALSYFVEENRITVLEHIKRSIREKSGFRFKFTLITETGKERFVTSICSYKENNGVPFLIGIFRDLTAEHELQTELENMVSEAEERLKARSDFMALISHEIKTPITGVMGILDVLQRTDLPEEEAALVKTGLENNKLLMTIISDILEMSRLESVKFSFEYNSFKPWDTLENLINLHRRNAESKGLIIKAQYEGEDVSLVGDNFRIQQILHNLIANAIKFTERGSILVTMSIGTPDSQNSRALAVSVEDTGIGIKETILQDIFMPFEQAEDSYQRTKGGAGLGLAIAERLARLMGGRITVKSHYGQGSTFTLELTLEEDGAVKILKTKRKSLPSLNILIAEDMPLNQKLIEKVMGESWNQNVTFASNGQEVLDILSSKIFDVIFMDIQMPIIDGVQVTRIIRSQYRQHNDTPIYALTANTESKMLKKYEDLGMKGVIPKPINWDQMRTILSKIKKRKD